MNKPPVASASTSMVSPDRNRSSKKRPRPESHVSENLTHTAQSAVLPEPDWENPRETTQTSTSVYDGMSEEAIFRAVTRPQPIEGVSDWGIPDAVDPSLCPPELTVRSCSIIVVHSTYATLMSHCEPSSVIGQGGELLEIEIRARSTYKHLAPLLDLFR